MKKIIFLFALVFTTLLSQAQTTAKNNKFRLGIKASPNVSWMKSDNGSITANGSALRFGYGLNFDIFFADNYAVGTGLNVNTTGSSLSYLSTFNGDDADENGLALTNMSQIGKVTRDYKVQYIQIPLTFKMKTPEIGYITYWGQFGLGLNFNLKAFADEEVDYLYYQDKNTHNWLMSNRATSVANNKDIKNDLSIFHTNLIFAGGIEYGLAGNTSLLVGITFQNGLTNILKKGIGVEVNSATGAPVYDGTSNQTPTTYNLQAVPKYIELNVGVLF